MSIQRISSSQKQIIQSNDGDYKGNLWSSFNIDLDSNPGVIKTSKKLKQVLSPIDWGDDKVQAITIHDGDFYAVTDDRVYSCPTVPGLVSDNANWTAITTLGTEDLGSETDAVSFTGLLLISLGTDIMSWNSATTTKDNDWWVTTTSGTALTANKSHTMEVLRTGNDTLFVTDGNKVRYYNAASGHASFTLDTTMEAISLTPSLDKMWAGTMTLTEQSAFVYELQVGNTIANNAYEVEGRACVAMFTYRNTPFVITERGFIQAFNGAGFETVAKFPWANESFVMEDCAPGTISSNPVDRGIHPKGVKREGDNVYILINNNNEYSEGTAKNFNERSQSGVWVLDLKTYSLSHRYSLVDADSTYGSQKLLQSGPILLTGIPTSKVIAGGAVSSPNVNNGGLWTEGTENPQGYFITTRHESDSIADAFEKFVVKSDTLDTNESITVKYKDVSRPNFPLTVQNISWLTSNQFTTSDPLTGVEIGDEIEIIGQSYAGEYCHVVEIAGTTTKTVTVDTTFGVLNDISDIQIDAWKKIETTMTNVDGEYKPLGSVDNISPSRQYKVWLKGNVLVREVISKSNSKEQL
jgi:hypothetical protein